MIHPTACIHPESQIGKKTRVGPFAVIEAEVIIGDECWIGSHAVVKRYTNLGNRNKVFEGCVLGGPPQDLKYRESQSYLHIGDGNTFREGVTIHRATEMDGQTRVGSDNYLMANAHVAHECVLENHVVLANCVSLAGHVRIQDHAFLSGGVVVHQFSSIGRLAMVGGNAKVTRDVPPFFLADGVPARLRSLNLTGLKRSGLDPARIGTLKKACHILFRRDLKLAQRIELLEELKSQEVTELVQFIRRSKRGLCRFGD
ncbi:MAG: acyl-ACP--UDP-N-acetylglucosamine O-acyltransferase [Acidobacteriota bacterium]